MTNRYLGTLVVLIGLALTSGARANLLDDAAAFPKGTTEAAIWSHFGRGQPIGFSEPGMTGSMYNEEIGKPVFWFCHASLTYMSSQYENANLIQFRHLVEENSKVLGSASFSMDGQTDANGQEWTGIEAYWTLPDGRTASLELDQYEGQSIYINQRITDKNSCTSPP